MKYKELIELYKSGGLSEEERKKIEEDIEKQEAISEYLYPDEEINEEIPGDAPEGNISEKENEFMRLIRKSIRKAFIKMGVVVTAVILVGIVLMMTILPKVVDLFYYNPKEEKNYSLEGGAVVHRERFELDLSVYTELIEPFGYLDSTNVVSEGYGNYSFNVYPSTRMVEEAKKKYAGNIRKGRITFYDPLALERLSDNMFEWQINHNSYNESLTKQLEKFQFEHIKIEESLIDEETGELRLETSYGGDRNDTKESIKELSDGRLYRAYITFDNILTYKEAIDFEAKYELGYSWVGIVNDRDGNNDIMGMNTGIGATRGKSPDKYPYIFGYEGTGEGITFKELKNEENAKKHYISLLNYLKDNSSFTDMMDSYMDRKTKLDRALAYVNEHGLKVYGMAVKAEKKDLLKLIEDERVFGIGIEEN